MLFVFAGDFSARLDIKNSLLCSLAINDCVFLVSDGEGHRYFDGVSGFFEVEPFSLS